MVSVFFQGVTLERPQSEERASGLWLLSRRVLPRQDDERLTEEVGTPIANEDSPLVDDDQSRSLALRANRRTVSRTE